MDIGKLFSHRNSGQGRLSPGAVVTAALILLLSITGTGFAGDNGGNRSDNPTVGKADKTDKTDKADKTDKDSDNASTAKSDTKSDAKSGETKAAAPTTDEQLLQLNEKVKRLEEIINQQQKMMESLQNKVNPASPSVTAPAIASADAAATPVNAAATATTATPAVASTAKAAAQEEAPLHLKIGSATITPVGFMDFTSIFRSTNTGSGIATNFGSIPYSNTAQGQLTEHRFSGQNSRIGARIDADVHGSHVMAYWESDFLGFAPVNTPVSTNSDTFRLRLFFVDVKKGNWEVLAGQGWSLMTPGRNGISPLPADVFYSLNVDSNYQAGITWARQPQFRLVYHPTDSVAFGVSLEAPEQYIGGSSGAGAVVLPANLVTPLTNLLDNGNTTLNVPNLHPDIVAKLAFDPKVGDRHLHIEFEGVARSFKIFDTLTNTSHTTTSGGGAVNLNLELFKGFRLISNNYYSDGGGRYIFGLAPDLIVRPDGTLSPIHSASAVEGFEAAIKNTQIYGYYGGVYIKKNVTIDTNGKPVGYGFSGSSNAQNRNIQEITFGATQTFWRDPKYGALQLMLQYSYLLRDPWNAGTGPSDAHTNMFFLNIRYVLPGSAPKVGK